MPAESPDALKRRASRIAAVLRRLYPQPDCALKFRNAFELLIATILAAQCTDERVNQVTRTLFEKYPRPEDFDALSQEQLEQEIRPTGFFRNKAKAIKAVCRALLEHHDGRVPGSMDALVALPGVGRKTANVVLGNCFGEPAMVVDTHVTRLSARLGLSRQSHPDKIERDLTALLPRKHWWHFCNALTWHGRRCCTARKPDCSGCALAALCPSAGKV
ncbi:MAG: endonuclease III [Candidatus Sumerlaeia bacterium]